MCWKLPVGCPGEDDPFGFCPDVDRNLELQGVWSQQMVRYNEVEGSTGSFIGGLECIRSRLRHRPHASEILYSRLRKERSHREVETWGVCDRMSWVTFRERELPKLSGRRKQSEKASSSKCCVCSTHGLITYLI